MSIAEITDSKTGSMARIATHLGFNCFQFVACPTPQERVEVIDSEEGFELGGKRASHSGIPLLFPFPNRIRGGRYSWAGKTWEMPSEAVPWDGKGSAIHGFCLDRPWRVVDQTDRQITGEFRLSLDAPERLPFWPADATIRLKYSLNWTCLRADITVSNPSDTPLPWGFGTHAYFRVPLSPSSEPGHCTVYAPARKQWVLNSELVPVGTLTDPPEDAQLVDSPYFDTLQVDSVYTDVEIRTGFSVCRVMDERAGLQMEQRSSADFREIVAFIPPWTKAVCLEPYTCVSDAINLQARGIDAGLQVLDPGASWTGWIEISVTPVIC